MPANEQPSDGSKPKVYSAEDVRQGRIALRKPWQRTIFIGGLVLCVIVVLAIRILAGR